MRYGHLGVCAAVPAGTAVMGEKEFRKRELFLNLRQC